MPRRRDIDAEAFEQTMRLREQVASHRHLLEAGVPLTTVCNRILPGGPWQRLQPGVVLLHTGTPTWRELLLGALAYAGDGAVVTGVSALRLHGIRSLSSSPTVHLLVPHDRRRQGRADLVIQRTRSERPSVIRNHLRVARPAYALIDACRTMAVLDDVRALVAEVVQRRLCSVDELVEAVHQAARQRTALPRRVLVEVSAGIRSAAEARVRSLILRHRIPAPLWNHELRTTSGEFIAIPDGYWELIGAAMQIDSMAWHLSPEAYRRTQRRQRALESHGIPVLVVTPGDAFADEAQFVADVCGFLERNADHRPPPDVVVGRQPDGHGGTPHP